LVGEKKVVRGPSLRGDSEKGEMGSREGLEKGAKNIRRSTTARGGKGKEGRRAEKRERGGIG